MSYSLTTCVLPTDSVAAAVPAEDVALADRDGVGHDGAGRVETSLAPDTPVVVPLGVVPVPREANRSLNISRLLDETSFSGQHA